MGTVSLAGESLLWMRTQAKSGMAWTSCSKAWVLAPSCTPTPLRVAHSLVVTSAQILALFLKVVTRVTRSDTGRLSFSDALATRATDRTVGLACIPMAMRVAASPLVVTTRNMAGSLNPTMDGTHHLMTGKVCAQDIRLHYHCIGDADVCIMHVIGTKLPTIR